MVLLLIFLLVVAFEGLRAQRRAFFQLRAKYRLFELRDGLRRMAIEDPVVAEGGMFFFVDSTITRLIATLPGLSVWRILGLETFCATPERALLRKKIEAELSKKENEKFHPFMQDIALEISKLLKERHSALFLFANFLRGLAQSLEYLHSQVLKSTVKTLMRLYWVDQKRVQRVVFTSPETSTVCEYTS